MRTVTAVEPGTPSATSLCEPVAPAAAREVIRPEPAKENSRNTWSAAFACVQVTTRMVFTIGLTVTLTPETKSSPAPAVPALPPPPPPAAAPAVAAAPPAPGPPPPVPGDPPPPVPGDPPPPDWHPT